MLKKILKRRYVVLTAISLAVVASPSHAIDVTTAVASIGALEANISDIGNAFILLAVVAVGYKWLKATLFS